VAVQVVCLPEYGVFKFAETAPKFVPGALVIHRRYGYRGLIVSFDQRCTAGERWYLANQTQPDRNQAWYHVLVHDSVSTTYAAESNLLPDPSNEEVNHPLVDQFFVRSPAGHYQRNDRPWTV